ncbi:25688_t:CDS:2 [Dentiscutata erythropus]|uniref:25688_t:CDS:1 n=1 Tax=Dentiscutata erythropus TaxID=1348616 RepID=A0A9N9IHG5_9GLOM|nr:25688_t:CDS:2 [Dentiscutata erythropus]
MENFLTINEKLEDFFVINEKNKDQEYFIGEASNNFMNKGAINSEFEISLLKDFVEDNKFESDDLQEIDSLDDEKENSDLIHKNSLL